MTNPYQISCGVILRDQESVIIARPTGHYLWTIPKGIIEPDDKDYWETAKRECQEETGLNLNGQDFDNKTLGLFDYIVNKKLYLFDLTFLELPDILSLKCKSVFYNTKYKKWQPELAEFKKIKLYEYDKYLNHALVRVFKRIYGDVGKSVSRKALDLQYLDRNQASLPSKSKRTK